MAGLGDDFDAMRVLDLYVYDYIKKRMPEVAEIFRREANVRDSPPVVIDSEEGFLLEWWSVFWATYSSRMHLTPGTAGGESSSSVQMMENLQQAIHQEAPVQMPEANHQPAPQVPVGAPQGPFGVPQAPFRTPQVPFGASQVPFGTPQVPFGANLDTMMTGQQSAYSLGATNYQEEQRLPLRGLASSPSYLRARQVALADGQANAAARAQMIAGHAQGAQRQAQTLASSGNPSSQQLQALIMEAQTQQQVSPRGNPHGVSLGRSATPGAARYGAPSSSNQQIQDPGKGKGIMPPSPLRTRPTNSFGNSPNSPVDHMMNSIPSGSQQQNPFLINQQPEFSNSSAQIPTNPLQGSTYGAQRNLLTSSQSFGNSPNSMVDNILNPISAGSHQRNTFSISQHPEISNSSAQIPANALQASTSGAQCLLTSSQSFGNSPNSTVNRMLNSISAGTRKPNLFSMDQQPEFSNSSAQLPANPLQGSTSIQAGSQWNPVLVSQQPEFSNSSAQPPAHPIQGSTSIQAGSQWNPVLVSQQPEFSNSSAQPPAHPIQGSISSAQNVPANPLQGSTSSAQNVMLGKEDSSGQDRQGGSSIQLNARNTSIAKNQVMVPGQKGAGKANNQAMILPGQQEPKQPKRTPSRNQSKKGQGKKRSSSVSLEEENSMVAINAEVDKLENVVDSFLSPLDGTDDDSGNSLGTLHRSSSANNSNGPQGFTFQEISSFRFSNAKVLCCNFSSDGKYLASAGHEKKVTICNMDSVTHERTCEGHANIITDVRFRPVSTIFATSSFDRTVKLWNANRTDSLRTLQGHREHVMSVDFHPQKQDLLWSCDSNNEIRVWDTQQNACISFFKGASRQVRFQTRTGNLVAAASGKIVSLIDNDARMPQFKLEGHANDIRSLCWDQTGEYLASVSEDSARIWSIVGGGKCVHELRATGNKFESCTFHPGYNQLLVVGSYQMLDLWNPVEGNKTRTFEAHKGIIASLTDSPLTELIASASHDQSVKVWR